MARYSKLDQLSEDSDDDDEKSDGDDNENLLYVKPKIKSKKSSSRRNNGFTKIDINDGSVFENISMQNLSKDVEDLDLRRPMPKRTCDACSATCSTCFKRTVFALVLIVGAVFTGVILYSIPSRSTTPLLLSRFNITTDVYTSLVTQQSHNLDTTPVSTTSRNHGEISANKPTTDSQELFTDHSKDITSTSIVNSIAAPIISSISTSKPSSSSTGKPSSNSTSKPSTSTGKPSTSSGKPSSTSTGRPSSNSTGKPSSTSTGNQSSPTGKLFTAENNSTLLNSTGRSRRTAPWTKYFNHTVSESNLRDTESCIRLFDVDEDGALDVILGLASGVDVTGELTPDLINETCHKRGTLLALRGNDSKILWSFYTNNEVFEINCNIDINKDGRFDCLGAGRLGTFVAFNPYNGSVYWRINPQIVNMQWNVYNPLVLRQDFTEDGVPEIIIPHGGEPRLPPEEHNRTAGRLLMLDGAHGRPVGRYLEMPGSRETYMSPILFTHPDQSEYILFGSGGETISGSFMGISVPDFYRYAMNLQRNETVNGTHGAYHTWNHKPMNHIGIIEIYRSETKGVMVSPVVIDMNSDGCDDILMSAYDGTLALYNGRDLKIMWMKKFPGHESYSSPAPGYFSDDDVIDFMVHWSPGKWPKYQYSSSMIIDGFDGRAIWMMNSSQYEMSSDLILRTTLPKRDLFVFRTQGREEWIIEETGVVHGIHPQRVIHKRTAEIDRNSNHEDTDELSPDGADGTTDDDGDDIEVDAGDVEDEVQECDLSLRSFYSEVFIFDRTTQLNPVKVFEMPAEKIYYNLTDSDRMSLVDEEIRFNGENLNPALTAQNFNYGPFCAVLKPEERTTGAIGDVDGDGKLDLIVIFGMNGQLRDAQGSYVKMRYELKIVKLNLEELLREPQFVFLNETTVLNSGDRSLNEMNISHVTFLPYDQQPWTSYMGRLGDSVYYRASLSKRRKNTS
ncbi:uncharacterized protein LOC141904026 isoform X2 [Tubulanus polymorphus]|uniref:uncharacterized protein LOC141904026 isoform X2 n=1 Tax=Tubulanus polymorphus TaxID=672921 RepID=UPI003DA6B9EE